MRARLTVYGVGLLLLAGGLARVSRAQDARALVQEAVETELRANANDHTLWRYRDDERDKGAISIVVDTTAGSVKRLISLQGRPLTGTDAQEEDARVRAFVADAAKLAKQRRESDADGKSARELLGMLPTAFVWKLASSEGSSYHLLFSPDASFRPPDMQSRVMGAMSGELVVDKGQHRIATISGRLTQDVTIGFGLLGRLRSGGTFRVERREVRPRQWVITETHVHIAGKALLFKTIGQEQDEVETEFSLVPASTTPEQAVEISKPAR